MSTKVRVHTSMTQYGGSEAKPAYLMVASQDLPTDTLLLEEKPWFESQAVHVIHTAPEALYNHRHVWNLTHIVLEFLRREFKELKTRTTTTFKTFLEEQLFHPGWTQGLASHQVWEQADEHIVKRLSQEYKLNPQDVKRIYDIVGTNNLTSMTHLVPTVFHGQRFSVEKAYRWGFFRTMSRVNHSCDPNCVLVVPRLFGAPLQLKSCRPLQKGEECTISYLGPGEHVKVKAQQLQSLWESYGIMCQCAECVKKCQGCHQTGAEKRRFKCGQCRVPAYCSKECQRVHWKQLHKQQCKSLIDTHKIVVKNIEVESDLILPPAMSRYLMK